MGHAFSGSIYTDCPGLGKPIETGHRLAVELGDSRTEPDNGCGVSSWGDENVPQLIVETAAKL